MEIKVFEGQQVKKPQKSKLSFVITCFIFQAAVYLGLPCSFGHTEHRLLITYSFIQPPIICIACIY